MWLDTYMELTTHIKQQAEAKGISLADVQNVLDAPFYTYDSHQHSCRRHGVAQQKWVGEAMDGTKLCVAVSPCCNVAITVFLDQVRTAIRPDQKGK